MRRRDRRRRGRPASGVGVGTAVGDATAIGGGLDAFRPTGTGREQANADGAGDRDHADDEYRRPSFRRHRTDHRRSGPRPRRDRTPRLGRAAQRWRRIPAASNPGVRARRPIALRTDRAYAGVHTTSPRPSRRPICPNLRTTHGRPQADRRSADHRVSEAGVEADRAPCERGQAGGREGLPGDREGPGPGGEDEGRVAAKAKPASTGPAAGPRPASSPRPASAASSATSVPTLTPRTTRVDTVPSGSAVTTTTGRGLDSVDARAVSVTQGGIGEATAEQVDVRQGGIGRVQATDVAVSQGGIGIARGDRISVEMGGIGVAIASEARVSQGFVRNVLARELRFEQGVIGTVVTGRATFERTGGVFLLIARNVDGNVKALLDWRGALAFGAVAGVLIGLLRRR